MHSKSKETKNENVLLNSYNLNNRVNRTDFLLPELLVNTKTPISLEQNLNPYGISNYMSSTVSPLCSIILEVSFT